MAHSTAPLRVRRMRSPNGSEYEVIDLPNTLLAKTGKPVFDPKAVARAEAAVASMQGEYENRAREALHRLKIAAAGIADAPSATERLREIYVTAHDLSGLGTSFGYPFVTEIAGALRNLVQSAKSSPQLVAVIDAHLAALSGVIANNVKGDSDPVTRTVIEQLQRLSDKCVHGATPK